MLVAFALVIVTIIFVVIISKNKSLNAARVFLKATSISVVVLVSSIPIAMQVVCLTTLAVGAKRLAQEKAIVKRLGAIEELASMSMLCSDKTGTLTTGKMTMDLPKSAAAFAAAGQGGDGGGR